MPDIVDAWMQHPSAEFVRDPTFDSLRRWKPGPWSEEPQSVDATLGAMDEAGVAVGMLCAWWGPSGPLIGNDEVAKLCAAHPDRFVGGHIGVPWLAEMISLCTKYPNVFVDTSAYTVARYPAELVAFLKGNGRRKVLFGSNHPFWPAPDCLIGIANLGLEDATQRLFLAENARRAFRLGA